MFASWCRSCAAGLLLVVTSSPALGSTVYPERLKRGVGLSKAPECTICHATSRGGPNTARKPFAQTLRRLGLAGGSDVDSLQAAIVSAEGEASDSDKDGATDVTELLAATSPNEVDDPAPESETPGGTWFDASVNETATGTGCGFAKRGHDQLAWPGLLVTLAFVRRRRFQRKGTQLAPSPGHSWSQSEGWA